MIDSIWDKIERDFSGADAAHRGELLNAVERTAFFQPARTLTLVRLAMRDARSRQLHIIPRLLRNVAYNSEYTRECCELLWELGRDDDRATNPRPDHPIRVLRELAEYDLRKPVAVHVGVLNAMEKWVLDPAANRHVHSPFDVLDDLLMRTGIHRDSDGFTLTMEPFGVSRVNTAVVRDGAIKLIAQAATHSDARIAVRAVESAGKLLHGVMAPLNLQLSADFHEQWDVERERAIGILANAGHAHADEVVRLAVIDALRPFLRRDIDTNLSAKASEVIKSISMTEGMSLLQELRQQRYWDEIDDIEESDSEADGSPDEQPWDRARRKLDARRKSVADAFAKNHPTADAAFAAIKSALETMSKRNMGSEPSGFLWALAEASPLLAKGLVHKGIEDGDELIIPSLPNLLFHVRKMNEADALLLAQNASVSKKESVRRAVAHYFSYSVRPEVINDQEVELVGQLARDPDEGVRARVASGIGHLAEARLSAAIHLAKTIECGPGNDVTHQLFMSLMFSPGQRGVLEKASDADVASLVSKLCDVPSIDDHSVNEFLAYAAKRVPNEVVELLLGRISRCVGRDVNAFRPMPYDGHPDLSALVDHPDYSKWLRRVRDQYVRAEPLERFWLPRLYDRLTKQYSTESGFRVLDEWIIEGEEEHIVSAAGLFSDASRRQVFSNIEWVAALIRTASKTSDECLKRVSARLYGAVISEGKSGTPGKPFPQDIQLKEQASNIAVSLQDGSPERKFFASLVDYAEREIQRAITDDEELEE